MRTPHLCLQDAPDGLQCGTDGMRCLPSSAQKTAAMHLPAQLRHSVEPRETFRRGSGPGQASFSCRTSLNANSRSATGLLRRWNRLHRGRSRQWVGSSPRQMPSRQLQSTTDLHQRPSQRGRCSRLPCAALGQLPSRPGGYRCLPSSRACFPMPVGSLVQPCPPSPR